MSWFEDWFDSPLYDALYADRDRREAEQTVDLITHYLPKNKFNSLLDLGCGRGRHAIALAEQNYRVTGVDLSPKSIEAAREQAHKTNLDEKVAFHIGDMREPLDQTFDAVLNLFTSFGYFESDEENQKVIRNMSAMTRRGGRVVIDFLNADMVTSNLKPEEEGSLDGADYSIRRYLEEDTIVKEIIFHKTGDRRTVRFEERVKAYRKYWFEQVLQAHELKILEVFGSYDGKPFAPRNSPRLILISEKE